MCNDVLTQVQHPASGNTVELVCYRYYSEKDRFLALTTSTEDPRVILFFPYNVNHLLFTNEQ